MAIKKEQVKHAAATYTTETEQEHQAAREKKVAISLYIRPSVYEDIKRLAHYRQTSAGTLIDNIVGEYLEANKAELKEYDDFIADMKAKAKK